MTEPNQPHVHGCNLNPDHRGECLSETPHQFGPDGCANCEPQQQYSDAALSVYRIIPPSQLAEEWCGEPYAIELLDENDQPVWDPAYDDVASVHGDRRGWEHVAAIVPPGTIHITKGGAR